MSCYYCVVGRGFVHDYCWLDYSQIATGNPKIHAVHHSAHGIAREVCLHCGQTMIPATVRLAMQLEHECETLAQLSGLNVYIQPGTRYFVFDDRGQTVKTVCTYRKAKVFAQGVATGRNLSLLPSE